MLEHYSHVRILAKRTALDGLSMRPAAKRVGETTGYDTNHDTNALKLRVSDPQVIDSLVELSGIEPLTSSLRTRRSPS